MMCPRLVIHQPFVVWSYRHTRRSFTLTRVILQRFISGSSRYSSLVRIPSHLLPRCLLLLRIRLRSQWWIPRCLLHPCSQWYMPRCPLLLRIRPLRSYHGSETHPNSKSKSLLPLTLTRRVAMDSPMPKHYLNLSIYFNLLCFYVILYNHVNFYLL